MTSLKPLNTKQIKVKGTVRPRFYRLESGIALQRSPTAVNRPPNIKYRFAQFFGDWFVRVQAVLPRIRGLESRDTFVLSPVVF
jgi:hypothetical protein